MTTLHPHTEKFLEYRFQEGVTINHEFFYDLFGLDMPRAQTANAVATRIERERLTHFERLRLDLRRNHHIDLQNVRGRGYEIVPYQERAERATRDAFAAIRKGCTEGHERLVSIPNPEQLPTDQRRIRDHGLTLLGVLKSATRKGVRQLKQIKQEAL